MPCFAVSVAANSVNGQLASPANIPARQDHIRKMFPIFGGDLDIAYSRTDATAEIPHLQRLREVPPANTTEFFTRTKVQVEVSSLTVWTQTFLLQEKVLRGGLERLNR